MNARVFRGLALAGLALVAACGGSDRTGPSAPAPQITLAGETFRPGDVITLTVTGLDVSEGSVAATLAGTSFDLVRLGDSAFAAFVPEVLPGAATLSVPFEDTTVSFPVTIEAAITFADPAATLDSIFDAYRAALSDIAPEGIDAGAWEEETDLLDSLLIAAKGKVAAMTPQERVTLARLLVAAAEVAPAGAYFVAAGDSCATKELGVLEAVGHAGKGIGAALLALPVGLFSETLEAQLMVTAKASVRKLVVAENTRTKGCRVPTRTSLAAIGIRGAPPVEPGFAASSSGAAPHRFFKGYKMRFQFSGEFRPLSRDDLSSDGLLATVDGAYRGVLGLAKQNLTKLPTWARGEVALLPPAVADRASGPSAPGELLPEDLQISAVSPASVSLTRGVDGEYLTLTSNNTVTNDVPFTFDVVNSAKPSVKVPLSGVLRPMMSATWQEIGHSFQGDRTTEVIGGVTYGKLTCSGSLNLKVKGGDQGEWGDFHWLQVGPNEAEVSDTTALAHATFQEGDHPFQGSWFWRSNVGGNPTYSAFTVYFRATYTDLVSNEVKETPVYSFTCN
jgi:hypothetical protein